MVFEFEPIVVSAWITAGNGWYLRSVYILSVNSSASTYMMVFHCREDCSLGNTSPRAGSHVAHSRSCRIDYVASERRMERFPGRNADDEDSCDDGRN